MPENMSFAQAAALPAVSLTALYTLHLGGRFSVVDNGGDANTTTTALIAPSNRSILIHSAAGGVGSMMVQMAKLLGLSPVVGVVGRTSKVEEANALGCDVVIDKQNLREESKASTLWELIKAAGPPDGYSIIADPNGVSTLQDSFDHLCPTGRLVAFGFHSNLPMGRDSLNPMEWIRMIRKAAQMPAFDPMELVTSNKSVMGFNLSFFVNEIEMLDILYEQIERWLVSGDLRYPRVTEMPMDDIGEAHQLIQSGKTVGKLVMIAADDSK
jgi:NADPH:quinone reductase-like Zn-dependent oxidoreductase